MRLVIAEKHSVAQAIGQALGGMENHDGYITAGGSLISWAQGHLVNLAMPDAYEGEAWADPHWSMESLPIAPTSWKWAVNREKGADKRYRDLVALASRDDVDELVNACDPDREGEAIFRRIMLHAGIRKPAYRLWVASLDEHAIRAAWDSMRPESDYQGLGDAADARPELVRAMPAMRQARRQDRKHLAMLHQQVPQNRRRSMGAGRRMWLQIVRTGRRQETHRLDGPQTTRRQEGQGQRTEIQGGKDVRRVPAHRPDQGRQTRLRRHRTQTRLRERKEHVPAGCQGFRRRMGNLTFPSMAKLGSAARTEPRTISCVAQPRA